MRKADQRPRRVRETLDPGLYFVRVVGRGKNDDRLSYKIVVKRETSRRRPAPAVKKPKPRPAPSPPPAAEPAAEPVMSDVLEVERQGRVPVAVLIEAGAEEGIRPGLAGELVEGDQVIGKLEVVDVYPEGSRARIVGGLAASITLDTRARVQK